MQAIVETKRKHHGIDSDAESPSSSKRRHLLPYKEKEEDLRDSLDGMMGGLPMAISNISLELDLAHKNGGLSSLLQHPIEKLTQLVTMFGQQDANADSSNKLSMSPLAMQYCRQNLADLILVLQGRHYLNNALGALSRIMQAYPEMRSMQMVCINTAQSLLRRRPSALTKRSQPFSYSLLMDPSIPTLLIHCTMQAMNRFSGHLDILYAGVDILSKLRIFLTSPAEDKLAATLLTFHMQQQTLHMQSSQQVALCFLSWLVEDSICRQRLIELGGIESCLKAMAIHKQDKTIQCNACAALNWMVYATNNAIEVHCLSDKGTIPPLCNEREETTNRVLKFAMNNCTTIMISTYQDAAHPLTSDHEKCFSDKASSSRLPSWAFHVIVQTMMVHSRERLILENCFSLLTHDPTLR